jgi:hypothetical protein
MSITWRYSGDGMVRVRIDNGDEFAVHYSRWNEPTSRRSIIAAEAGDHSQPWWGELNP